MFVIQVPGRAFGVAAIVALFSTEPVQAQEAWMIVTHEVDDFDRWKEVFDQALPIRRSVGEIASYILHTPDEPEVVTVWFEWDTIERARAWASDPALANGMIAAGVVSTPVFTFQDLPSTN